MTRPTGTGFTELRANTLELLEKANRLLGRAGKALSRRDHYRELAAIVENELHKVRELELRMAIVAPMKAGKSTIINAILGQGILPTRNSAMTTIPAEIVCDNSLKAPILNLHRGTVERFQSSWRQLHVETTRRGLEIVARDIAEYPELLWLLRLVHESPEAPLSEETVGVPEGQRALSILNDLCRLTPAVMPDLSPLMGGVDFEVPRLTVPFLRVGSQTGDVAGRLVIVDTPGPNEARNHAVLERIVSEELKSTSLVLVVLDFTQLNTQAAEALSRDVHRVVETVGEENLFVIVNKIDERGEKGMTADEVRQFVASHLRLKDTAAAKRIFEVSAKRAFAAANFLRELETRRPARDDATSRDLARANDLAMHVYGATSWEEGLAEASTEDLEKRAQRLWKLSNFEAFLSQALETVMTEVAPRCIAIALKVARTHLLTLRNDTSIRLKGIAADAAALEKEVKALNAEMDNLVVSRRAIEERVRTTRRELREHLESTRRGLQPSTALNIEEIFRDARRGREGFLGKLRRYGKTFVNFFGFELGASVPFIIEFDTLKQANTFAQLAIDYVIDEIRPQISDALERVDRRVEGTRFDLEAAIEGETRPVLLRAAQRLRKEFDVRLEIPRPDLGNPFEAIASPNELSKRIEGGYVTEVRWERKWYVLWLFEVPVNYKVKKKDRFIVSLDDVAREVNETIRANLETTARRFDEFLDGEFKDRIDSYFRSLVKYLTFYRDSVEKAQETQKLSLQEREIALSQLSEIGSQGDQLLMNAEELQSRLRTMDCGHDEQPGGGSMLEKPIDVFFSYSHKDEVLRDELEKHLSLLKREGIIRAWHDRSIGAGEEWKGKIDEHLEKAQIVLLLISADFLASQYCYDVEMSRALERHEQGTALVVPIILRNCEWHHAPFSKLNALPKDGKPVKSWPDMDEAFTDVARGIRAAAKKLQTST